MEQISKHDALAILLESKVNHCLALAEKYYHQKFEYQSIQINLKGRAAGQIRYQNTRSPSANLPLLRFNPYLLKKYGQEFIDQVVPHECAHLVVYVVHGFTSLGRRIRPHGSEWKAVMQGLYQLEPKVTHNFEVQRKQREHYIYLCQCHKLEHSLSVIRHNKVLRGQAKYLCKHCKEGISYKEQRVAQ